MLKDKLGLTILILLFVFIIMTIYYNFFATPVKPNIHNNLVVLQERIKPIGEVYIKDDIDAKSVTKNTVSASKKSRTAESIYNKTCSTCHNTGLAGAPKFKNKDDWSPRIKQGIKTLIKVAIDGKGAMPARGTCGDCSDDEISSVVNYIINNSK